MAERLTQVDIHKIDNDRFRVELATGGLEDRRTGELEQITNDLQADFKYADILYKLTRAVELSTAAAGGFGLISGAKNRKVLRTLGGLFSLTISAIASEQAKAFEKDKNVTHDLFVGFLDARSDLDSHQSGFGTATVKRIK